jgi:hypothetical protein
LDGPARRFETLDSLGALRRRALSDQQADQAIHSMRSYYDDGKPVYGSYFRHLQHFLTGLGAAYSQRTATHLDLVQESTDPVWSLLDVDERSELLERDLPFLAWQIEHLTHLRAIVCTGQSVSRVLEKRIRIERIESGTMKRIRWWVGRARVGRRELPVGGWNYPLDRPTGLGTAGEVELGALFRQKLL